jgi:hypothetical protein
MSEKQNIKFKPEDDEFWNDIKMENSKGIQR